MKMWKNVLSHNVRESENTELKFNSVLSCGIPHPPQNSMEISEVVFAKFLLKTKGGNYVKVARVNVVLSICGAFA